MLGLAIINLYFFTNYYQNKININKIERKNNCWYSHSFEHSLEAIKRFRETI
jgi:hypothetical protein